MKDTAEESASLKMALKHDPATPALRAEAALYPLEGDEAYFEVLEGYDTAAADSWVAAEIEEASGTPAQSKGHITPLISHQPKTR